MAMAMAMTTAAASEIWCMDIKRANERCQEKEILFKHKKEQLNCQLQC